MYQRSNDDSVIRAAIQLAIDCDDVTSLLDIIHRHINIMGTPLADRIQLWKFMLHGVARDYNESLLLRKNSGNNSNNNTNGNGNDDKEITLPLVIRYMTAAIGARSAVAMIMASPELCHACAQLKLDASFYTQFVVSSHLREQQSTISHQLLEVCISYHIILSSLSHHNHNSIRRYFQYSIIS